MTSAASRHTPATIHTAGWTGLGRRRPSHAQRLDRRGPARGRLGSDDSGHDHRRVVGPSAEVRQIDQRPHGLLRRQTGQNRPEFGVFDAAGQPVAADQVHVARGRSGAALPCRSAPLAFGPSDRVITFLGIDRADVGPFGHLAARLQLPLQAVVERQLAQRVAAQAIDAAVADVGRQRPCGKRTSTLAVVPMLWKSALAVPRR